MKKKNFKFLNHLGFALLMIPLRVAAMQMDDDALPETPFERSASHENELEMSDLLSNESTFDMENGVTQPSFGEDEFDVSGIPFYPDQHPFNPYSSQYDETANANSHSHSHSNAIEGSGSSMPAVPNPPSAFIVQQQTQQPEMQTMQEQLTHSANGNSASSSSAQSVASDPSLVVALAVQNQMQQATEKKPSVLLPQSQDKNAKPACKKTAGKKKPMARRGSTNQKIIEKTEGWREAQAAEKDEKGLWICPRCSKRLAGGKQNLVFHIITHTGERPFKCCVCKSSFAAPKTLKQHELTHIERATPHACLKCDRAFSNPASLNRHLHTHEKADKVVSELFGKCAEDIVKNFERTMKDKEDGVWQCPDSACGKKIAGPLLDFKKHLYTHTKEKPYGCSECTRTFRQNSSLNKHMRTCKAEKNSSSSSNSSSNSNWMSDEDDEDEEMEEAPSAPAGKTQNKHAGKKRNQDDSGDHLPTSKRARNSIKQGKR